MTAQLKGCNEQASLTDSEIAWMIRCSVPEGPYTSRDPFGCMRLTAVCDLAAGHAGPHASLMAVSPERGTTDPWFLWNGDSRTLAWPEMCPEPATADHMGCLLYAGHAGPHHLCPGDCAWIPSWVMHAPDIAPEGSHP